MYIVQVLPSNQRIPYQISKAVMKFPWMRNVERTKETLIYRTVSQGGLGMVNKHLFYHSLFLYPMYKVLTGPSKPESSLLCYFMSFPLLTNLQRQHRNRSSLKDALLTSGTPVSNLSTIRLVHPGKGESNGTPQNI